MGRCVRDSEQIAENLLPIAPPSCLIIWRVTELYGAQWRRRRRRCREDCVSVNSYSYGFQSRSPHRRALPGILHFPDVDWVIFSVSRSV